MPNKYQNSKFIFASLKYKFNWKLETGNWKLVRGFTLIELLLVISIIGILATFTLFYYPSAQKQARDAQRRSDIKQYQTLLETFAGSNNNLYPSRTTIRRPDELCGSCGAACPLGQLSCPRDPSSTTYEYSYLSNGTGSHNNTATQYVLWTTLENIPITTYWIVCSSGRTGTSTVVPPNSDCPI